MNIKSKKWQITLLLLLILISVCVFITFAFGAAAAGQNVRSLFLGTFSQNPFKKTSEVKISLVDSQVNLSFDLVEEDKPKFAAFIKKWFEVESEIKTLSLGVDENMKNMLSQSLPADLRLTISEDTLQFNSNIISGLKTALIKNDIEFATGSSRLNIEYSDSSKYQLKLEDPADLAHYATASGKLTASSKLEGLFKTLPKIATIELNVSGKNISGQIRLK